MFYVSSGLPHPPSLPQTTHWSIPTPNNSPPPLALFPPSIPQKDEELRRFAIDRLAYKVLATALQLAAEYVESDEVRSRGLMMEMAWFVG